MKAPTTNFYKLLTASAFGALALTACGDDVTKTTVNESTGIELLAAGEKFPECTADNAGDMLFAADSGKVYYCADGAWSTLNGENGKDGADGTNGKDGTDGENGADGASCTAEALKDSSGYTVICDGDTVGTLKNGTDGKDGKDGENGKDGADGTNGKDGAAGENGEDGTSCTATELADGSGYTLICGGKTVGTLKNGANGTNGKDGSSCTAKANENGFDLICGDEKVGTITNGTNGTNGESCTVSETDTDGSYTITCGSKTVTVKDGVKGSDGTSCELADNADGTVTVTCGKNSATLYKALCGTTAYDPAVKFCSDGKLYELCGGKSYDPATQYCSDGTVATYKYCDTTPYKPETQICSDGSVLDIKEVTTAALNAEKLASDAYGTFIDTRDGQLYRTIEIGGQVWMAQNLNYKTTANSYCYENNDENCETYGRLYTWEAANGACPEGFHLPTEAEFNALLVAVGNTAGTALKATSGWENNGNGTDAYGFSALPAGYRDRNGVFNFARAEAAFWNAETGSSGRYLDLYYTNGNASLESSSKLYAFSVRCLKD